MRILISLTVTALASLALALAACSGDSDDTSAFTQSSDAPVGAATTDYGDAADEEAGAVGAAGGEGVASASLIGRTIIRNGYIVIEVESVGAAFERVGALAVTHGGYVADSSFSGEQHPDDDEEYFAYASLTLRVPAERYDLVIADLRALAQRVLTASSNTQDVTGEVTDLTSDLRNLRAVESQYLELLGRAREIGDVVLVQDRLAQTRGQIERIEGSLAMLQSLAALSTLSVELQSPPTGAAADGGSILDAARGGWEASLATLDVVARAVLAVAAFSWWIVPVVVVALAVLYRRGWLSRRAR